MRYAVALGDVNRDGRVDLVTTNAAANTAGVLLGQAAGGFAPATTYLAGANNSPYVVLVWDANGDSRPGILTVNTISNSIGVLLNTDTFAPLAAAPAWQRPTSPSSPTRPTPASRCNCRPPTLQAPCGPNC